MAKVKTRPEIIYYPYVGETLNDKPFDLSEGAFSWSHQLKILADKAGYEIHTPDKARWENVEGVIFFDNLFYHNLDNLLDLRDKKLLHKTVYIDYEPPTGHAKKHEPESIKKLSQLFKNVITYDDTLAGTGNFVKANVANFHSDKPSRKTKFENKRMICMVTHNTTQKGVIDVLNEWNYTTHYNSRNIKYHPKAIYHKRPEIADFFLTHHPDKFDLYGGRWPEKYSPILKGPLDRKRKLDVMSGYKFAITFDSYTDQRGYISEKIFDAFFAGVVPVYLGADNVTKYIPRKCFVDMRDFSSYEALYNYLEGMSDKEYQRRLSEIKVFLKSQKFKKHFSSEGIASTLFSTVCAPARKAYSYKISNDILDQLVAEKSKIQSRKIGVVYVGKHEKKGRWYFAAAVSSGGLETKDMANRIVRKTAKGFKKVNTYINPPFQGGSDMVQFDIGYGDVVKDKKQEYYYKSQTGLVVPLRFFAQDAINGTNVDTNHRYYARANVIGIRGVYSTKRMLAKIRNQYHKYRIVRHK